MSDYNFTENEIKEMFEISRLALLALTTVPTREMSKEMDDLDNYLGNQISKELWDKLDV